MTRRLITAAWLVGILVPVSLQAGAALAAPEPRPAMTASELAWYMIENPVEEAGGQPNAYVIERSSTTPSITDTEAVAIAQAEMGRTDTEVRTYSAMAHRIFAEPARPAWVVLFRGGEAPQGGPAGAPRVEVKVTGVIIDATTGEVMSIFMDGVR